jgi:hypothetical protein
MLGGTGRAAVQSAREILEYVARVKAGEEARVPSHRR